MLYKKTKKMDYCIKHENKFGLIKYFIYNKNICYAKNLISGTTICAKTDSFFCLDIRKIKKCIYIVANNIIYVSKSSTGHLFH